MSLNTHSVRPSSSSVRSTIRVPTLKLPSLEKVIPVLPASEKPNFRHFRESADVFVRYPLFTPFPAACQAWPGPVTLRTRSRGEPSYSVSEKGLLSE